MLSMKKCLKDILVFGSLKNHKQYIVKSITVPCRIAFYELYICFVYFPFKKHGKDTLYSQNLEQCFIYINIVIYMCIYISTHTHQIETNRKNPNLIIFPRMSFLVIFTYYTLRNPSLCSYPQTRLLGRRIISDTAGCVLWPQTSNHIHSVPKAKG